MVQPLTLLIVDDCPEDRQVYRRYLLQDRKQSYTILEEESGEGALDLCRRYQPDGILLDFRLPDLDGLEFLTELKHQSKGAMPAVIMLTGYGNETVAVQAMKSGVQDYLVKGQTTPERLYSTIHSAIKNVQLSQELQRSEERFHTSVENMLDCFGIYSAIRNQSGKITDFHIDYVNAATCEFNQMTKEEQLGKQMCEILPVHRENGLFDDCCQVVETGQPLVKESLIYTHSDGKQQLSRAFDIRISKMADGFVAAWRDVTAKKQAERQLRETQQFLERIAETTPGLLYVYDLVEQQNVYLNSQVTKLLGYAPEKIQYLGTEFIPQLMHPEDYAQLMSVFKQFDSVQDGDIIENEYRMKHANGEWRWFGSRDSVFTRNPDGSPHQIVGMAFDITDRKQLEAKLNRLLQMEQAARAEAETANHSKDEFVAMVSHDLRSPLNAIMGWAKLLRTRHFDKATINSALETIERNAQSQAKLLEDLLNISRILRGKLQLEVSPVNLVAIVEAAIETAYPSANEQNICLESVIDQSIPPIIGDSNRLLQVLGNLLSNAIKFTPSQGRVEVRLSRNNDDAQIIVSDTGIGISSEFIPHIFERYRQANRIHKQGGLGLGLAIARHLVELHGGTIQATSPGEGQGATFTVNLPLA
jgi:PAS domain S-box-containing protein